MSLIKFLGRPGRSSAHVQLGTLSAPGATVGDVITVQADGTLAPEAPSGPGGPSAVLSATTPLTNAQIKALPGTDVELVAAPGLGKTIVPFYAFLITDFAVAYSGIDANTDYPAIWVAQASSPIYLYEFINQPTDEGESSLTSFLTGTNEFGRIGFTLAPTLASAIRAVTPAEGQLMSAAAIANPSAVFAPDEQENVSLKLGADNSINFTGGDAANNLTVTVLYTVLDV